MRVAFALLVALSASAAQARPATFVTVHRIGMAALPAAFPAVVPPRSPPSLAVVPPGTGRARYLTLITREAIDAGLPVAIADAVARIESGYDPTVVGSVGEVGLMQVRPSTAAMLGFRGTVAELATPEVNVRYGVRYLARAWRLAGGDLCRALTKYRAGHGAEAMSPLSQTYCARARVILAGTPYVVADAADPPARLGVPRWTAEPRRKGSPDREVPRAAPMTFWEAHRARVAKANARVLAGWRARGWKSG